MEEMVDLVDDLLRRGDETSERRGKERESAKGFGEEHIGGGPRWKLRARRCRRSFEQSKLISRPLDFSWIKIESHYFDGRILLLPAPDAPVRVMRGMDRALAFVVG